MEAVVYSSSLNFCHPYKITSFVKGVERDLTRNKLMKTRPLIFRKDSIRTANMELLTVAGNYQQIKSESVIRKARSEALNLRKRFNDDNLDLTSMQKSHAEYIKQVSFPLNIKIFSNEQLLVLQNSIDFNLYFDATGSVVRNQSDPKSTVYYYAGVVVTKNHRVCPVLEMVSSEHATNNIQDLFVRFINFCKESSMSNIPFETVVTDFSFANIHAVCLSFNEMTLNQYLSTCFDLAIHHKSVPKKIKIIRLCAAHFMKNICTHLNEFVGQSKKSHHKSFIKELIACAFNLTTFEDVKFWFENACIILMYETYNDAVQIALHNISSIANSLSTNLTKNIGDDDFGIDHSVSVSEDFISHTKLRKNSPFYKEFLKIFNAVVAKEEKHNNSNIYCCKEFMNYILDRYIPFLPMWTLIIHTKHSERVTNNAIERYFGILKNEVLERQTYLAPSLFIRHSRDYVLSIYREVKYNIGKEGLARAPKTKKDLSNGTIQSKRLKKSPSSMVTDDKVFILSENDKISVASSFGSAGTIESQSDQIYSHKETWKSKPVNKRASYFRGTHLKRQLFADKLDTIQEVSEVPEIIDVDKVPDINVMTPVAEKSFQINFLPNGLINSIEYYLNNFTVGYRDFIVARFDNALGDKCLNNTEFKKISKHTLTNKVANILNSVLIKKYQLHAATIWSVQRSRMAIVLQKFSEKMPILRNITYMILNEVEDKWVLLKIDIREREVGVFKPFGLKEIELQSYLTQFVNFVKQYNTKKRNLSTFKMIPEDGWRMSAMMSEYTLDPLCSTANGLMVYWILTKLVSKQSKPLDDSRSFDHEKFIKEIQTLLIHFSDDMTNNCLICGKIELDHTVNWIRCNTCGRWFHTHHDDINTSQNLDSSKATFACLLCQKFFNIESSTHEIVKSHLRENALMKNVDYYVECKAMGKTYTVAKYYNYGIINVLSVEDYQDLHGQQWLSSMLIDQYLNLYYKVNCLTKEWFIDYLILESKKSEFIFFNEELQKLPRSFFNELPRLAGKKVILIPILRSSHFTLAVVDFENKTFHYLNPMKSNTDHTSQMFIRFKKFISEYKKYCSFNADLECFQLKTVEHDYQTDTNNCGIFVLFYIEAILNKNSLKQMPCTPQQYRINVKEFLLENSDDMQHVCMGCAKEVVTSEENFLKCTFCLRLTHTYCLYAPWTIQNVCHLCVRNYNPKTSQSAVGT
nr:PREDICTED: uncharacterized protein LOC103312407 [Tribolium castaneum]XP_015833641.1 PREDICTED: uncharacterized protein LOC103312407 [Tribolium castaneum]XP_015833642.1 PREDICTED: uncharacterized protein LOC103312407 [Tribolium castaneum]XP_015833643.1 PREDICTED: uncharacterized protein LOC103312407 [Tribolium castaneum]XP_015833644.1 PREDICTED: uncharacterized protein LOC103312407 [Tribolium castaneum]XP_015833645.1 PREDICTED: uncharacterized protein LOC103312407 [Tribolium castaneum]XP_01|eukprot:XP_015833640.1 PREDICTED: uncharacterized protein LOC103312407 [Tribolium castaneum]